MKLEVATRPARIRIEAGATVLRMDEARKVLDRLARIEALEAEGAHPPVLLAELRALVVEAEAWVRIEQSANGAGSAVERCREALEARATVGS